jgi:hypothetical protein
MYIPRNLRQMNITYITYFQWHCKSWSCLFPEVLQTTFDDLQTFQCMSYSRTGLFPSFLIFQAQFDLGGFCGLTFPSTLSKVFSALPHRSLYVTCFITSHQKMFSNHLIWTVCSSISNAHILNFYHIFFSSS